jgi:outer membrane scaffolding protein for murein synthesis (MipA/OmpV family)
MILQVRQWKKIIVCLLPGVTVIPACSEAQQTEWELGAGVSVFNVPLYPGSSQEDSYIFPYPYLLYRSERLEIENGVDLTLFRSDRLRFNLSADLGVPVNSSDSDARKGMPDLDLVVQIGPSLEYTLAGGRFKPSHTRFELPLRAAIATDIDEIDSVGWIIEPRLSYETRRPYKTGFANNVSLGFRFASEELHGYYYDVATEYVTAERPAFHSDGGYGGFFADYIANWRTHDFIFWSFVRYQNLDGAEFDNSPLVEQTDYLLFGGGVTWLFARSL